MSEHQFESMRDAMVSNQLRTTAVSDPRVVAAMQFVPREQFVPADRKSLAYIDVATPLTNDRSLNLPMATGRLLTEARIEADDHVLLIGAATGYAAVLLSQLAGSVVAVEVDDALSADAAGNLKGISNVTLVKGGLAVGAAKKGPYDVIVIDGQIAVFPDSLVKQLKDGGRVVTGFLEGGVSRLSRGVKSSSSISFISFADSDCVPLPGFDVVKGFSF